MCTVTLVPLDLKTKSFVLTSNRDEGINRKAEAPAFYFENGVQLLYPKDVESGGSWIGLSAHSRLICLLNGGFEDHVRKDVYRLSRGVVLKDLLTGKHLNETINKYDFTDIEPFTIIAVDWRTRLQFFELVWDGITKHMRALPLNAHIWSSSPLYNSDIKLLRESWFASFLETAAISSQSLWEFHHNAGIGDKNLDVIMDRGFIKTQSVSQIEYTGENALMTFENLDNAEIFKIPFKMS